MIVLGHQPVEVLLEVVAQAVVCGTHVGPERVASRRRHFDGPQDRAERWREPPGDIAVPEILVALLRRSLLQPQDLRGVWLLVVQVVEQFTVDLADPRAVP